MLDRKYQKDDFAEDSSFGAMSKTEFDHFSKRYESLLTELARTDTSMDLERARHEIWQLGTHVPPKYKEPCTEDDKPETVHSLMHRFSMLLHVHKRSVNFAAKLLLIGAGSYLLVEFVTTQI